MEKQKNKLENTTKLFTDTLVYHIKLTEKYSKMLSMQLFSNLNAEVSPDQFLILDIIYNNPEVCQRDIAKLILKDRANTGRLIESLEKKGFIERIVDTRNNRLVKKIIITETGIDTRNYLIEKILPLFQIISDEFTDEEVKIAMDLLERMRNALKKIIDIQI